MTTRGPQGAATTPIHAAPAPHIPRGGRFRMAPVARAIAIVVVANGALADAQAQRAFSGAWFAGKNAAQSTATATGRLPNGMPASMLTDPQAQRKADEQLQRSIGNLNLAARSIAAQQAAQAAARDAASNTGSDIPDGLAEGGLKVDTNSLTAGWLNANAPVQTAAGGRTVVGIEQTDEKAILNWERFNVGQNTTVRFDQKGGAKPDGTNAWIALNRINDPSGKPSRIAGQIQADGAVYLVNRNGIVFGGASQVNTRTLVASSLALSDKQFNLGINNPQVLANQGNDFAIPQFGEFTALRPEIYGDSGFKPGSGGTPDRMGGVDRFDPGAAPGGVTVEAGARLAAAAGGKVMLFAPKVRNAGHIAAPDGQVILAAGENVFLKTASTQDPNAPRGLDVAASAVPGWAFGGEQVLGALGLAQVYSDAHFVDGLRDVVLPEMAARAKSVGYEVVNSGTVQADRGNITLQAQDVRQSGVLASTSALNNRNGSILLRAWGQGSHMYADGVNDLINWSAGTLTLGTGSIAQVLPDASDTSEIESSALATRYQPGRVSLFGQLIDVQANAGVLVPAGTIRADSAVNPIFTLLPYLKPGSRGDASRIYLDSDAFLSVAGLQDMRVDMSRNFIEAELRINELRDSPLLLDSWLRGKKVIVDRRVGGVFRDGPMAGVQWVLGPDGTTYIPGAWTGTPLADVTGWVGVGKTDLRELSADAGSIELRAGGAVITRAGSMLDVSGGSVRYTDGMNTATKLMGADGRVHTMDRAMPETDYTGIAGEFTNAHARWGVKNTWRTPLIGANHKEAGYTEGRKAGSVNILAGDAMVLEGDMLGGVVVGDRQAQEPAANQGGRLELGENTPDGRPWSPGTIIVTHDPKRLGLGFDAKATLGEDFYLPLVPDEQRSPKLTFLSDRMLSDSGMGTIVLNNINGDFELAKGSALDLSPGASLFVAGTEGSTNDIRIHGPIRAAGGRISLSSVNGTLEVGEHGRIDASGQWINAWRDGAPRGAWAVDGGAIVLNVGEIAAHRDAVFDVSGGGRADLGKKGLPSLRVGDAGSIALTGVTPELDLGALNLRAHAAGAAGSLSIETASAVQIGGALNGAPTNPVSDDDAAAAVTLLPATLFGERGFGRVTIAARGEGHGIEVPEGVTVSQQATNIDLSGFAWRDLPSGRTLADVAPLGVLRPEERAARTPASLSLGTENGPISVARGATVRTDTGGTLSLEAGGELGALTVAGRLDAPAGRIALSGAKLTLEAGGELLARGAALIHADSTGRRVGEVRDGGTVEIRAGELTLEKDALIDVSGATGTIDGVPDTGTSGTRLARSVPSITLDSNGGLIQITGKGLVESTMRGAPGGPGGVGGRIRLNMMATSHANGSPLEQLERVLPDPDCYGFFVDGNCGDWKQGLDFDWAPGLRDWGYDIAGPMVLPSALLAHLADRKELVLSDSLEAPGVPGPLDPAAFGLSPQTLDNFRDTLFGGELLRDVLQKPGQQFALTLRPQAFRDGGFADLALVTAPQGAIRLDNAHLALGRSISLQGPIVGHAASSSSLRAPHILLATTPDAADVPASQAPGATGQLSVTGALIDIASPDGVDEFQSGAVRITGFGRTVLEAGEIRLGGALPAQFGQETRLQVNLDVDGQLQLNAGQVYPATAMTGIIRAGDSITVERLGDAGGAPLSAGGSLRLEAPVIAQNGVLRAPFGQIELAAGERLALGAGSLTSVSGAGLAVPYGTLSNNEHWQDPSKPVDPANPSSGSLVAPPEKRITLKSPDVALAPGAVVDIAGGGELHAAEFVPGPGGSHDVLNVPGMYAILPGQAGAAPAGGAPAGQRVWLAGGPGLAAGWYNLLPARFALLPGAFAVQATGKAWGGAAAPATRAPDGSLVMQGRAGNAYGGNQDAQATTWRVMPGGTLRRYTEYNEATANDFFSSEAFKLTQYRLTGQDVVTPRLPRDGGAVVFDAGRRLVLDGTLRSAPDAGGRGGLVDIAGKKIAIVGRGQDGTGLQADGYLVIDSASLSNFGAGSLLVGGKRQGNALGLELDVTATDIVVRNDEGSELFGPEVILAASEQVAIDAGSRVSARGRGTGGTGSLVVKPQVAAVYTDPDGQLDDNNDGVIDARDAVDDVLTTPTGDWGALVRVATGDAVKVIREGVDTSRGGLVTIGAGAVVDGGNALLIDATRTTELAASAQIAGADLSVAAGRIGFGGGTEGMVLDSGALAQLSRSTRLTLRSYSDFDFYGSLDLGAAGLKALTLDGAAFVGRGAGDVVIRGEGIALANSGGGTTAGGETGGSGAGGFTLDAATLVLGAGQKSFSGFGSVTLTGREGIVGEGVGGIDTGAAPLTLNTPLLTGRGGAVQSIATGGALQVLASPGSASASIDLQDSLGLRLGLTGRSIAFGGRAVALGGSIDMTATGGSLVVADGALIDVGGFAKQFFDVSEYADAGRINLSAVGGDVRLDAGGQLNLAAHPGGGDAGTLSLAASGGGTVVLDGRIAAQAGANGGRAGSFALDIETLPDFAGFSQRLNDAGFNRSRQFRIRQGDVVLGGLTTVEDFGLTADRGSIDIAGTVDARSAYGGAIRITGGNGVAMQAGARLLAGATGSLGNGRVTLEAAGGQLDLQGGLIDVAGNEGGKVRLRAQQNAAHDDLAVAALRTTVAGARSAVLEGVSVYDVKDYDGATVDSVKADAIADAGRFSAASAAVAARLGTGLTVMPGIEIRSAGDLALNGDWNLFSDFAAAREGTLTLRAGGNLALHGHLSDGFDAADRSGLLQAGASWNLRLVAGGELGSADALALKPLAAQAAGKGSIVVGTANTAVPSEGEPAPDNGAGKQVRTGTGDLDVRAGRDLVLAHKESVVYTAGRRDTTAWSDFTTANPNARYGVEGGNLAIGAQGSIEAAPSDQHFTEWLNRQGNLNQERYFGAYTNGENGVLPDGSYGEILHAPEQSSWWVNHGQFQQGVGALGGGNVSVDAGGDLRNLLVALPTHMRMRGGRSASEAMAMEVRNGGAMTVTAGGAIRGGQYYVARGAGDIRAGETAVGRTVVLTRDDGSGSGGTTTTHYTVAPVLALGDATLSLRTAGDLRLQSVIDPLLVTYGEGVRNDGQLLNYGAYMSGYTDRSALKLVSTGGDITFVNRATFIFRDLSLNPFDTDTLVGFGGNRYPARLSAAALNGGLSIEGPLHVLPGTTNDVTLVAKNDIRFDGGQLAMAYATPAMMPSGFLPGGSNSPFNQVDLDRLLENMINWPGASYIKDPYLRRVGNPDVLPLGDDFEPSRIYASQGSIIGLDLRASEQTWVRAGTDIRGVRVAGRNLRASDVTLLEAGNDILAVERVAALNPDSHIGQGLTGNIEMQGPGTLVLAAGRDLYADNLQVQTLGNQRYDANNRAMPDTQINGLPEQGAAITAMAGLNSAVGYDAMARAYLDPAAVASMPDYLKTRTEDGTVLPLHLVDQLEVRAGGQEKTVRRGLVSYMKTMTGETLAPLDAWARFQQLPQLAQQQFLRQVYLLELREAGRDQNEPGTGGLPRNGGYNRGHAAIKTLFPGDSWKGDVAANTLMLRTQAGGDINVLTPGGGLQVAALGATVPPGYGLVTLASGHIDIFARNDVTVNQSRILSFVPEVTQQGSDQIIWSTIGDIDAGRGSKTLRVPSAPEVVTDLDGATVVREKSDMSGSGIGTVGDGDVDLVAPGGTVNAGDAGLRVAGNLNIAALQVLNADNIQVKGETKGLPVIAAVNIGALTNASAAAAQATAAAQDVVQRERAAARQALPSVFTVRVLGFGNEPAPGGADASPPARGLPSGASASNYDARSPVQVVGMGPNIDPAHWAELSSDELRRLRQDR